MVVRGGGAVDAFCGVALNWAGALCIFSYRFIFVCLGSPSLSVWGVSRLLVFLGVLHSVLLSFVFVSFVGYGRCSLFSLSSIWEAFSVVFLCACCFLSARLVDLELGLFSDIARFMSGVAILDAHSYEMVSRLAEDERPANSDRFALSGLAFCFVGTF